MVIHYRKGQRRPEIHDNAAFLKQGISRRDIGHQVGTDLVGPMGGYLRLLVTCHIDQVRLYAEKLLAAFLKYPVKLRDHRADTAPAYVGRDQVVFQKEQAQLLAQFVSAKMRAGLYTKLVPPLPWRRIKKTKNDIGVPCVNG